MRVTTSSISFSTIRAMPFLGLLATAFPSVLGADTSLITVYESIEVDPSDYTIHDPSRIITIGNKQMIAVTGKAQEDGYDCGLETWWRQKEGKDSWTNWKPGQCLFQTKPSWVADETPKNVGAFWAPELDFNSNTKSLKLIYSVAEMGDPETEFTCTGVATSTTGITGFPDNLTWEDAGEPLTCLDGSEYPEERSVIDPSVFWGFGKNKDKLFLVTGGGMITGTELDPTTYLQKNGEWFDLNGDDWTDLSSGPNSEEHGWVEAAYIHPNPKTGYYYLFVNWGGCCNGIDSTYEIRVGRSKNPMGPYLDKNGKDMMQGGGTLLQKTRGYFIGPGHTGIWKKAGKEYISFHYYDRRRDGNSWIAERRLRWRNGWPKAIGRPLNGFPKNEL